MLHTSRLLRRGLLAAFLALTSSVFGSNGRIALETANVALNDSYPAIKTLLESKGYTVDIVNAAQIDTAAEIALYDLVCIGDSGHGQNDWAQFASTLKTYVQAGGAVVASGWVPYFLSYQSGTADIAELLPSLAGSQYQSGISIVPSGTHPITDGVGPWNAASFVNYGGGAKPGATVVATNGGSIATVTAWDFGGGRVVHLAPNYFVSVSSYHHQSQYDGSKPDAQRLLLNAIDWAMNRIVRVALETSNVTLNDSYPAIKAMLESNGFIVDIVNAAQIDTLAEISVYNVVCIGDSGHGQNDWSQFAATLKAYVQSGGGVVASGWVPLFTSYQTALTDIADILPSLTGSAYQSGIAIVPSGTHPITAGVNSWTAASYVNYGGGAKSGATVVATDGGNIATVTAWNYASGRVAHLAPNYLVSASAYGHQSQYNGAKPDAQRMLINAIAWAGNGQAASEPADTTAPVITVPDAIAIEATSAAGATVTYSATALDDEDGAVSVTLSPASGSVFEIGTHSVTATATDAAGNTATATFSVTVQDTTAPTFAAPASLSLEATSASGAAAIFSASANDTVSGSLPVTFSPSSGSIFALGTTTVTATATDTAGNSSTQTFTVTVSDTTAPSIGGLANIVREATGPAGAIAVFGGNATDIVSGDVAVSFNIASGSTFPLGTTLVVATATDAAGNTATAAFSVTVQDTLAPTLAPLSNLVLEATSSAGTVATFSGSAQDIVSGDVAVIFSIESGSTFALGTTSVTATATDASGNSASSTFNVTVQDTTAPVIAVPAHLDLEATSSAGAVANFAATAADLVDGNVAVTSSIAPGSTFAIGTTTVQLTSTDAAGNSSSASFTVTVKDTTAPVFSALTPSVANLWPANHKMVAVSLTAVANDTAGPVTFRIVSAVSNEPDNGLGDGDTANDVAVTGNLSLQLRAERSGKGNGRTYTITVEASDAAGNTTTRTTTVSVSKNGK